MLTQKAMGDLFGCSTDNISLHLKNIFLKKELDNRNGAASKTSAYDVLIQPLQQQKMGGMTPPLRRNLNFQSETIGHI